MEYDQLDINLLSKFSFESIWNEFDYSFLSISCGQLSKCLNNESRRSYPCTAAYFKNEFSPGQTDKQSTPTKSTANGSTSILSLER